MKSRPPRPGTAGAGLARDRRPRQEAGNVAGLGPGIGGSGVDRTAGAAMYVMQQAMAGASAGSQDGPSFDSALNEVIQDAGKEVIDAVKKVALVKK